MKPLAEILAEVEANISAACAKAGRRREDVEIVAVTKTHGPEVVREAWEAGLRIVGENKVRPALELFDFFHSVDSLALAERMNRIADEIGSAPHILLEVNVSGERSKSGLAPDDVPAAVEGILSSCPRVTLEGFMTMAPFVPHEKIEETRPFFARLREMRDAMEERFGASFPRLSMGMTNDYTVAVEEGATWVRLGTVLFGERPKAKPQRMVDAGDAGESGEGGGEFDRVLD